MMASTIGFSWRHVELTKRNKLDTVTIEIYEDGKADYTNGEKFCRNCRAVFKVHPPKYATYLRYCLVCGNRLRSIARWK